VGQGGAWRNLRPPPRSVNAVSKTNK